MSNDPRPPIEGAKCCATCRFTRATKYGDCTYMVNKPKHPNEVRQYYSTIYPYLRDIVKREDIYGEPKWVDDPLGNPIVDWKTEADFIAIVEKNLEEATPANYSNTFQSLSRNPKKVTPEEIEIEKKNIIEYAIKLYEYERKRYFYYLKLEEQADTIIRPRRIVGTQVCSAWESRKK